MKKINYKYLLFVFSCTLLVSCRKDNMSILEPELSLDLALYGTWDITKLTTTTGLTAIFSHVDESLFTIKFNRNGVFESTTVEFNDSKVETGVWEAVDGILTVLVNGEEYIYSPYTI